MTEALAFDARTLRRRPKSTLALSDADLDSPSVASARMRLSRGDFHHATELLAAARADPNERFHLLHAFADWEADAPFLRRWEAASSTYDVRVIQLIHRAKQAWLLGPWTHRRPKFAEMHAALNELKRDFGLIARQEPQSALSLPHFIWILRGLSDPETARKVFREGVRRQPDLRALYTSGSRTEAPQWFGSRDDMDAFIAKWTARAPAGIGIHSLVFDAACFMAEGDRPAAPHQSIVWKDPLLRERLEIAMDACEQEGFWGHNGARTRHHVAYIAYCLGDMQRAANHFAELGPHGAEIPWGRLRFGLTAVFSIYKTARKEVQRAVGR